MSTPRTVSSPLLDSSSSIVPPRQSWRAAAVITALAVGALGTSYAVSERLAEPAEGFSANQQASFGSHDTEDDVLRLRGEVRDLKMTLQVLRQDLDRTADNLSSQQVQAQTQIDRTERATQDTSITLARVAAQVDQVESRTGRAAARLPAASSDGPTVTGSVRPQKPTAQAPRKEEYLDGWTVREVNDDGLAVVESRTNGLFGVRVGNTLPAVGRVEKVERRGKIWVVVTTAGTIGTAH